MKLSEHIRELAGKADGAAQCWSVDAARNDLISLVCANKETILAALELYERMEAPGCVEGGWIVGNGAGDRWRTWGPFGSIWTDDRDKATRYARRCDAELVHAEDEDVWLVVPFNEGAR